MFSFFSLDFLVSLWYCSDKIIARRRCVYHSRRMYRRLGVKGFVRTVSRAKNLCNEVKRGVLCEN